jgi:hypothetical protein
MAARAIGDHHAAARFLDTATRSCARRAGWVPSRRCL